MHNLIKIGWLALAFFIFSIGLTVKSAETEILAGYWGFDEIRADSTVADLSGNGGSGKIIGAACVSGRKDQAFQFKGKVAGVRMPNSGRLAELGKDSVEISFWIKTQQQPQNSARPILQKVDSSGSHPVGLTVFQAGQEIIFTLWDKKGKAFGLRPNIPGNGIKRINTAAAITDRNTGLTDDWNGKNTYYAVEVKPDTWTYISCRIDLPGEYVRFFWSDGQNCGLAVHRAPGISAWDNSADLLVGGGGEGNSWYWSGAIDELKLAANPGPAGDAIALLPDQDNTFEEAAVEDPCVIPGDVESNGRYRMWYTGLFRGNYTSILYATSPDGIAWIRKSPTTAVLFRGPDGAFDSEYVRSPWVAKAGKRFLMWYTGWDQTYEGGGSNFRIYERIGLAESQDGRKWTRIRGPGSKGCCLDTGPAESGEDLSVGEPCVLKWAGLWRMWYKGTDGRKKTGIFCAVSKDGLSWQRQGMVSLPEAGDLQLGHPVVCETVNGLSLYVSAEASGNSTKTMRFVSKDGVVWQKAGDLTVAPARAEWFGARGRVGSVIEANGLRKVWFSGLLKNVHTTYPEPYWKKECRAIGYREIN